MKIDEWFPRCYDLSMNGQAEELLDDFLKTTCRVIIRKHQKLFNDSCLAKVTFENIN